jgi:hypothetical protein
MAAVNDTTAAFAAGDSGLPTQEVQVDLTTLTALSPEVISKQATVRGGAGTLTPDQHWHDWARRARQVVDRARHLGRADRPLQERARA